MDRGLWRCLIALAVLAGSAVHCPAPLTYVPGEGWVYEAVGSEGKWKRSRAKEQLEVAQAAFEAKNHGLALKAAKRLVNVWPVSDYAPEAQSLVAKSYEAKGDDERAFKEYQKLVEKYPKQTDYEDVAQRQFEIASRFLGGKWFKLWGFIPSPPSMEKTAKMFNQIVENGPYSSVAPEAQLSIGAAREKQRKYPEAVKAFERAADRYHDQPDVAANALFKAGMAYNRQTDKADYDQSMSIQAIDTLTDFMTLYPDDPRVDEAERVIGELQAERARGSYQVAQFYEGRGKWNGALVYYNEVLLLDPVSPYADEARERIDTLKKQILAPVR